MDDAENVEQIYVAANWSSMEAGSKQPEHSLRDVLDGLNSLLKRGYAEAPAFCNSNMPQPPDSSQLHRYWFCPTAKGRQAWETYSAAPLRDSKAG